MKKRIGIFGESECGKTTLAISLSKSFWALWKIPTLALDPNKGKWGSQAWTTSNVEYFKAAVDKKHGCLVVVEDTSATINRDRDFNPFFTTIRHNDHHLMVIGHDGTDLLRTMRQNLNELFLFNHNRDAVEIWRASQPSMKGLEKSVGLERYFFIHAVKFATVEPTPKKLRL